VLQYSPQALGQVVRHLRERKGATQEELGHDAGYGAGAGVSISRLEHGLLRPGAERFAGIAGALGLTSDELVARAVEQEAAGPGAATPTVGSTGSGGGATPPGQKELNARRQRIEEEIGERTRLINDLSEAYNEQHDRARDAFFLRFVDLAGRIDGAPPVDPTLLEADVATSRDQASSGGVAPTLAAQAAGASAAARGAGIASVVLIGVVAAPTAILLAGGLAWVARRNRRQRQEFAAQLGEAEAELAATRPGIQALQDTLLRAASTLEYVATHAGHALARWADQLGSDPASWEALGPDEQRRYLDFLDVAQAQAAIVTFDFQGLLITRGPDQAHLIELADRMLTRSRATVQAHV